MHKWKDRPLRGATSHPRPRKRSGAETQVQAVSQCNSGAYKGCLLNSPIFSVKQETRSPVKGENRESVRGLKIQGKI